MLSGPEFLKEAVLLTISYRLTDAHPGPGALPLRAWFLLRFPQACRATGLRFKLLI
jgi:hypothetical protein